MRCAVTLVIIGILLLCAVVMWTICINADADSSKNDEEQLEWIRRYGGKK